MLDGINRYHHAPIGTFGLGHWSTTGWFGTRVRGRLERYRPVRACTALTRKLPIPDGRSFRAVSYRNGTVPEGSPMAMR